MEENMAEAQYFKIKKQNSKRYYIIFTEQFMYFKNGFYNIKK